MVGLRKLGDLDWGGGGGSGGGSGGSGAGDDNRQGCDKQVVLQ